VLCLILALAVAGLLAIPVYLAHYPVREDPTTEFYILGNNWTTGDYPKNFQVGVPQNIYVTIQNHEYHDVTYAFEVYRVNETLDSSGGGTITRMDLADTWAITIPHGEQRTISQKLLFTRGGYNKLEFLLFANSVPPASVTRSTRIDQSYRNLHLWVTVRSNSTAAG
jgi:uncharacterized membrane protein